LCLHLSKELPEFLSEQEEIAEVESNTKKKAVTFRRVLLSSCLEEFEGAEIRQIDSHHWQAGAGG
jgi:translation initiation factor 4G